MKTINKTLLLTLLLFIIGFTSCQKENTAPVELFDIEEHTGRYIFDIDFEVLRDGELTKSTHTSIGYITKESDYVIKVLFDFAAPKVNCVYEYAVRTDGSFYSLYRGAGDREGLFVNDMVEFSEMIDLGDGNYKQLMFTGKNIQD